MPARERRTPDHYKRLARERGFRWLGPAATSIHARTTWQCSKGHRWQATFNNIRHGSNCPFCTGHAPKTPGDYQTLAAKRGFRWLGPMPPDTSVPTGWACPCGHEWRANYTNVQRGTGCPQCAHTLRITPEDYRKLAQERRFRWLGPVVPNTDTRTGWECTAGHCWQATYHNVRKGTGCLICSNRRAAEARRLTAASFHALAAERGFIWTGTTAAGAQSRTTWRCAQEHVWRAAYSSVKNGTGCPHCARKAPKTSEDYLRLAAARGFRWLGPLPCNVQTKTNWACNKGHQWQAIFSHIQNGRGCPICAHRVPFQASDYHALATQRGFRWLGKKVPPRVDRLTTWGCPKGHVWQSTHTRIRLGINCPECTDLVNGVRVSGPQRKIAAMLGGDMNVRVGRYSIDVAVYGDGGPIAVEYDSWFWHQAKQQKDRRRDAHLRQAGWRVLRVKSNFKIPDLKQLEAGLRRLREGAWYSEITLPDWGQ